MPVLSLSGITPMRANDDPSILDEIVLGTEAA
jgi:hypothetical protein